MKGKERTVLDHGVLPVEEAWGATRSILGGMKTPRERGIRKGSSTRSWVSAPRTHEPHRHIYRENGDTDIYIGKMEAKGFLSPLPRPQTRPIILSVSDLVQRGKISFQS